MVNFSVVIPIFNEKDNIQKLIEEIFVYLESYNQFEIIIVNDGSKDDTEIIVKKLSKKYPINLINNKTNNGQSFSINEGVKKDFLYKIIESDPSFNEKDFIQGAKTAYDMILSSFSSGDTDISNEDVFLVGGIRKKRKDSFIKIISSKVANSFRSFILDDNCKDTGCSLKIFDKNVFLNFPYFNGMHRFLPALFKGYGKKTIFIEVDHRPRIYGISKYGTWKRLFRGIRDLIKVLKIIKEFKRNNV